MSQITQALTHRQEVMSLYRAGVRELRNWNYHIYNWRFNVAILRNRFDKNKNIKDLLEAKKVLRLGQAELERSRHPVPFKFAESPGGIGYMRNPVTRDAVFDTWHPLEKAQYPDFFANRVQLKKEYIEWYKKTYNTDKYNPNDEGDVMHAVDDHSHSHEKH